MAQIRRRSEISARGAGRRPGRPEGSAAGDNTSERILDAAEEVFAEVGYSGATLRMVAARADVTQALINYYFGSKYGLYEAVFIRRGRVIADGRMKLLEELKQRSDVSVRDVVRAFLAPTIALRDTPGGRLFLRLQARLHTEPADISYKLRNEAYDVSTRAYVQMLAKVCPELSAKDVNWRMALMIGAYMYVFSDTHRLEQLAPDDCDADNTEELFEQITAFITAGIGAPPTACPG